MDRLSKRWKRRERYSRIFGEHGEDEIDIIFDRVLSNVLFYEKRIKKDRTLIPVLRKYARMYEDLLLCGVYNQEVRHSRFLSRIKKITRPCDFQEKMFRRVVQKLK